jgi:hypothetical protein
MGEQQGPATYAPADPAESAVPWAAVNRMLDGMDVPTVLAHRLGPLAAIRWRETGRDVPELLLVHEQGARVRSMQSVPILARARAAYPGRMMLLKGPELEWLYPQGGRWFRDLDLLVDDPKAAFHALLAAGFEPAPFDERPHHLPALWWPESHLPVELHTRLKWPRHLTSPPNDELFAGAVPTSLPVEGLEAPGAAHHAVMMAAHAWAHLPLRSIGDLLDVTLLAHAADARESEDIARRWGLTSIWGTTTTTSRWLFEGGREPAAVRLWARSLREPREPTILERHVSRWVSPFWMLPFRRAVGASMKNVVADMQRGDGEPWRAKLRRIVFVATHPSKRRSDRAHPPDDEAF